MHIRRFAALALLSLAACNGDHLEDITSGGSTGGNSGFDVTVVDDPALGPTTSAGTDFTGTLDTGVRISLRNSNDDLVQVGPARDVMLALQDPDGVALKLQRPPAGTYNAIQIELENPTAAVLAGSVVEGDTLDADRTLDLASVGLVTVERSFPPFTITNDSQIQLLVDLNAETWVTTTTLDAGAVTESDLADAFTVTFP